MGSGIPQYRWRERHQSRKFRVQSYWRASPAQSGYHLTDLISSSIFAFRSVTFRNHCFVARKRIGVLQRQQCPYRCVITSCANRSRKAARSSMICDVPSRVVRPPYSPASSVNTPLSLTGLKAGSPSFCPRSKSSGPCPGAVWTHPVLSAVTVSDRATLWTQGSCSVRWYGTFPDRGCVYLQPSRSAPDLTSAVSYCSTFAVAITALTFSSTSQRYSTFPARVTRTFAYLNFGFTATHRFAGRVHGVVVQTRMNSWGLPTRGNFT